MADHTEHHQLVKLSDTDFRLEGPQQDIRGLNVYDYEGNEIGSVQDLYIDAEEHKVRFLDVGAGGFLGIGEKHFMVPVEAVWEVGEEGVTIAQDTEKVMSSPPFDTDVAPPTADYQREVYGYYGYTPTWGPYGSGGV